MNSVVHAFVRGQFSEQEIPEVSQSVYMCTNNRNSAYNTTGMSVDIAVIGTTIRNNGMSVDFAMKYT